MRKTLRWMLATAVLIGTGTVGAASAGAAAADKSDIKDKILAIDGMSLIEEKPAEDGYRYFVLNYEQPVDHRKPDEGTFKQRISILHKSEDRPNVFFTSGYNLNTQPSRSEPTRIIDGNQVSMEYRFFDPSRPDPADWTKLDIWQAASDQHRIFSALNGVYDQKWVSTGGSKGGMTATYYRRFYPEDMDGTVAYVAPNNVDNKEDSAYDEFFANVSTKECREALSTAERQIFERRDVLSKRMAKEAEENGYTYDLIGDVDKAYEVIGLDVIWSFWQYSSESDCANVPAGDATDDELYTWVDEVYGWSGGSDDGLLGYTPYYYQAGTQLGQPSVQTPHLDDLLKYPGINEPRTFVPRDIPMDHFDDKAMADIDEWVRTESTEMLYVNGENDPWSAEPFRLGDGSKDSHLLVAPGANHGANIEALEQSDRATAIRALMRWADQELGPEAQSKSAAPKPLAKYNAELDRPMVERTPPGLP
ncbi:aminopeptidase [Streptomyces sp. P38-E01]|uniref:Aminopeptidase n=1 Tax=Streptomyces tardus TaxID=2780544 RepID=A0A949JPE9_9ACTN|nr:S28 family serine protease [Streptomyces tardus]MBU7598831.1 aminopeptidase [Streptomyces tardus]